MSESTPKNTFPSSPDSGSAFEQWTDTDDFEAAHGELLERTFLDPASVDRHESVTTITPL